MGLFAATMLLAIILSLSQVAELYNSAKQNFRCDMTIDLGSAIAVTKHMFSIGGSLPGKCMKQISFSVEETLCISISHRRGIGDKMVSLMHTNAFGHKITWGYGAENGVCYKSIHERSQQGYL